MKPLDWLAIWFKPSAPSTNTLRAALDEGRRAKFADDVEGALAAFDRARAQITDPAGALALTAVDLHKVEILIEALRFAEAEALLDRAEAAAAEPAQRAYLTNARGMLRQAQGDLDAARTLYESARAQAKAALLPGAEGRAACHLGDVVLADGNAAYAVHLLRDNLPRLQTAGDLEWSCHFVGVYGQALIETGETVEGVDFLRSALSLSEGVGYRRYERRWSVALAEHALKDGRYHDADSHLERALRLYDGEQGIPPYAQGEHVSTLILAARTSLYLRDGAAAVQRAETAVSAAAERPTALTAAQGMLGIALRTTGRSAAALPHLQAAATSGTVEVLRALAAAYADTGDQAAAEQTYLEAIDRAAAHHSPLESAQARRDYGLMLSQHERYADAIAQWTQALTLFDDLKAKSQVARLYTDIGSARRALGYHVRAVKDYEAALMLLNSLDEYDLETRGLVMANAAVASAETGDVDTADNFFSEAITIAERTVDQAAEAVRLGNYAWFLLMIGKPRRAIASLERGLALCEKLDLHPQLGIQTDNLALAHDALAEYPRALELHRRALTLLPPLQFPYWHAVVSVNTAHTLIALGDVTSAEPLLEAALTTARANPGAVETVTRALNGRALIALDRRDPAGADAALTEAILLARRHDLRRALAEALSIRSRQHAALDDATGAAAAWQEASQLYGRLRMPQAKHQPTWLAG